MHRPAHSIRLQRTSIFVTSPRRPCRRCLLRGAQHAASTTPRRVCTPGQMIAGVLADLIRGQQGPSLLTEFLHRSVRTEVRAPPSDVSNCETARSQFSFDRNTIAPSSRRVRKLESNIQPRRGLMSEHAIPSTDGVYEDDDPVMAELRRIRVEQLAAYGNDLNRMIADDRRRTFLQGNDVVARDKRTGRLVVIFKGSGKPSEELDRGRG